MDHGLPDPRKTHIKTPPKTSKTHYAVNLLSIACSRLRDLSLKPFQRRPARSTETRQDSNMADITRLPTEILRMIWCLLSLKDMARLSATRQVIRHAGQSHFERFKRYSIITNTPPRQKRKREEELEARHPSAMQKPNLSPRPSAGLGEIPAQVTKSPETHFCLCDFVDMDRCSVLGSPRFTVPASHQQDNLVFTCPIVMARYPKW